MRALVVYGTTEGQTRKIAEQISDWLRDIRFATLTVNSEVMPDEFNPAGFDVYILAGSLHSGKHQPSLVRFVKKNRDILWGAPSAFISVSMTASRTDEASLARAQTCIDSFIHDTGWMPKATKPIGGALLYTKYNFFIRWIMKKISAKEGGPTDTSRDYEFTDWKALETFIHDFLTDQGLLRGVDDNVLAHTSP